MAVARPSEAYTVHTDEGDAFVCVAMVTVSLDAIPDSEQESYSAELIAWAANHATGLFAHQWLETKPWTGTGTVERFWFAVKEDAIHFDLVWS